MYDHNQTFVADSFLALYAVNGRPTLGRREVEARHDACEDLAAQVAAFCETLQLGDDLSAQYDALRRCHRGLLEPPAAVSAAEARWVVRRVVELLAWDVPAWLDDAG